MQDVRNFIWNSQFSLAGARNQILRIRFIKRPVSEAVKWRSMDR